MNDAFGRRAAVEAAVRAGRDLGATATDPLVLQDTNNVVVWLRPDALIAKVGVRPGVAAWLEREVAVCRHLRAAGAPVAEPVGWSARDFPVSIWRRLESRSAPCSAGEHGAALAAVHQGLRDYPGSLPSYWVGLEDARRVLLNDVAMSALPSADLALVRDAGRRAAGAVSALERAQRPLHGEPHVGNIVATAAGAVLIDFEACCVGPVEWDLACAPAGVEASFPDADEDLLSAMRLLNNVRIATWCWASTHPAMRAFGVEKLEEIRRSMSA